MAAQMEQFLDTTGNLRATGELEDKATAIFVGPPQGQNAELFVTKGVAVRPTTSWQRAEHGTQARGSRR